jgi:hypothetical protein
MCIRPRCPSSEGLFRHSVTFGEGVDALRSGIGPIFVINLGRQVAEGVSNKFLTESKRVHLKSTSSSFFLGLVSPSSLDDRASKKSLPKLARPHLSLRLLLSYLMVCESRLKRFRPRIRRDTGAFRCRPSRRGPLFDLSVLPILPGDRAQSDRENIDLHLSS